ncbi:PREDICTED: ALK tyrosine kinase receptor [Vollenhovia emeryi]|uniref:ALK tyrosine kinase receptor n=1 Tax=Vollenhovia emeryi TaxID=411798 RepID=UPI0005F3D21E|nr:PREDICTED: ALK tyrosine kinase receptor [Vollenhovia emeryi]XP_011878034.1 PREDICTED: ALK tyrosine kinase receptor [Vollenhovia emeryi]
MINDTRPRLATTIAGYSQTSRACDRRHVSRHGGGNGGLLLRTILICCCITVIYGLKLDIGKSFKDLRALRQKTFPQRGYCDLDMECDWEWTQSQGFKKVQATALPSFPHTDADNSLIGHFLWFTGKGDPQIWSKTIQHTGPRCRIEFWLFMVEMEHGFINLVIQMNSNNVSSIAVTKSGNNTAKWNKLGFQLRPIDQPYKLFLEVYLPYANSSIGVDNIRLVNCFSASIDHCTKDMFRCHNGSCLNMTRVCDFTKDCADGEDEFANCDKIPENARCNFENGWCGWTNEPGRPLNWTLHSGPTPTERTGPRYDHTYRNETGMYAFVNMASKHAAVAYGSRATMTSPVYNPTPPYSNDPKNPYYRSCQVRFFYHKHGAHSGSLGLFLIQVKPYGNHSQDLWWSYGSNSDTWYNEAIVLDNIRYRYHLQFEASRGYSSKGDIAVDDISLSPECFGIGVPSNIVGDFDYYKPVIDKVPPQHPDFVNETVIRITNCGNTGRNGPTIEKCAEQYNNTDVELVPPPTRDQDEKSAFALEGVQRWTAPRGEYYTFIAVGARGGKGSSNSGSSLGAFVRGVIELQKGDQLYFMMGQEGTNACTKNLGLKTTTCYSSDQSVDLTPQQTSSKVREVKKIEFKNPGGGGGGATAIFMMKANGEPEPILIAGGGGGLGLKPSNDDGVQHGRGSFSASRLSPSPSNVSERMGGPGGNWNGTWPNFQRKSWGMPIIFGGIGGLGCESGSEGHGNGGFGGGGGGCQSGGGGGGYVGGNAGYNNGNGEGGYSYASQKLTNVYYKSAVHFGAGEVFIIPAISGCGCDYRCVALDQYLSETKCLCPQGWLLSNDSKSCIMTDDSKSGHQTYIIQLLGIVIGLFTLIGICLISYKRYQKRKALSHRRQVMFGNGTELAALHPGHVSDTMMTEFNPNYEFAGNLYSFKDLPQIPRECITLVKPLGQGAFGEVFQGVYKYGHGEEHPVAVKTLPSLSTTQAEADFMMEALIMSKFNHPNIVHFIGVSFDKHPRYIVLELLAGGDLKNFLREERPRSDRPTALTMLDLIMCSYDVSSGCKYMEEARFIHRDIAARNCLLTTKAPGRTVKIADFGMARDIYRSDYYRKGGKAMLPIKWMPPESFLDGIFTTKTDVWAFGVLLWEIMSFGYMPYTGCANREVMSMVTSGGRLEKPAGCPDPIYGIMTKCWHPRPDERPSFSTIAERIGYCLQDPDVINQPTPNFDILPICDREITIMRPDPEAECINVQSDLDGCGYMQPRVIDPRSVARRVDQAMGGTDYDSENEKSIEDCKVYGGAYAKSMGCRQGKFNYNSYDSSIDAFEQVYGDNDHEEDRNDEDKRRPDRLDRQDGKTIYRSSDIEGRNNIDNGNNRPEDECHMTANIDSAITDRKNGNESTTTTDTNSDSLIAQSSDTPPDTTTNSSPNTRTCSPSRTIGLNANVSNVNGMVKKNTLKATLSLDPSALCRGTIPYEKITTRMQRSSTPGSMELRKDSLNHELPREEECSC